MDSRVLGASRPRRIHPVTSPATSPVTSRGRLFAAGLSAVLVTSGLGVAAATAPAQAVQVAQVAQVQTSAAHSTYEQRVQRLVNKRRANHDIRRLRAADCPDGTAERWSRHLASTGLFEHQSMSAVLDACDAVYAGETLGRGTMTPRRLVTMWMQSPPHRAVLLSQKSRRIGIGASVGGDGRMVVTANFIRF